MAEHRTRKQSLQAQESNKLVQYSYRADVFLNDPAVPEKKTSQAKPENSLFAYDPKFIFQDVRRTAIISSCILVLLLGITLALKQFGW